MKYIIYIIAIILLFGINLGLFGNLPFFGQAPSLLFLLTLYFSLEKKDNDFFFIAFVSGIFLDFFSAHFFGAFTFSLLFLASILRLITRNFIVQELNWKYLTALLLGSLAIFRFFLWFYAFSVSAMHLSPQAESMDVFFNGFVWSFLYNAVLLYPVYLFYGYLKKLVDSLTVSRRSLVR